MFTAYLDCIQGIICSQACVDFAILFFHFTNPAIDDMNVILIVNSNAKKITMNYIWVSLYYL